MSDFVSRHSNRGNNKGDGVVSSNGGDVLRALWEMYLLQPRHEGYVRHLVLADAPYLNSVGFDFLLRQMRGVLEKDRPGTLTWHPSYPGSSSSWRATKHICELIQLCQSSLKSLYIANYLNCSSEAANTCMSRTCAVIENLDSLFLDDVDFDEVLVQIFASTSRCKIRSFSVRYEESQTHDFMIRILTQYRGLKNLHINCTLDSDEEANDFFRTLQGCPSSLERLHLHGRATLHAGLGSSLAYMLEAQQTLKVLDLRISYSFGAARGINEPQWIFSSTVDTELFMGTLALHPSLKELSIMDCTVNNHIFTSLLLAAEQNPRLETLVVAGCELEEVNEMDATGAWLRVLPRLHHLTTLVAFAQLVPTPEWTSVILPKLRQNTCLLQLEYTGDDFLWARSCVVFNAEPTPMDSQTRSILRRNQLLRDTAGWMKPGSRTLSLGMWPYVLWQLASPQVDPSALYHFLQKKSTEIPESQVLQQIQQLAQKMSALKDENKLLNEQTNDRMAKLFNQLENISTMDELKITLSEWRRQMMQPL